MPANGFYANAFRMHRPFSLCFRYSLEGWQRSTSPEPLLYRPYISPSRLANRVAGLGFVAIVPPNILHSATAGHCRRLPNCGPTWLGTIGD